MTAVRAAGHPKHGIRHPDIDFMHRSITVVFGVERRSPGPPLNAVRYTSDDHRQHVEVNHWHGGYENHEPVHPREVIRPEFRISLEDVLQEVQEDEETQGQIGGNDLE